MKADFQVILVGGGAHARVVFDVLRLREISVLGFVDPSLDSGETLGGLTRLGDDSALANYRNDPRVELALGIGSVGDTTRRSQLFDHLRMDGHRFHTAIHPQAILAHEVQLGEGAQVMAGAILQPGVELAANTLINTGARIDHDCLIGEHVHIAPGAILSGKVRVGDRAHVGSGAVVLQGVSIGAGATVGAGAVVLKDVVPGSTVVGVPAGEVTK